MLDTIRAVLVAVGCGVLVFEAIGTAVLRVGLAACDRSPHPLTTRSPVALSRFTRSNNALGLDLYGLAQQEHGNVALSPLAISNAIVLLSAGARGETRAQIQRVFHTEGTGEEALDTAGQIVANPAAPAHKLTLHAANRLFVEKSQAIEPALGSRCLASRSSRTSRCVITPSCSSSGR